MSSFFISSLKELNLSNFNTNNVTDIKGIFTGCPNDLKIKIITENKNIKDETFETLFLYQIK